MEHVLTDTSIDRFKVLRKIGTRDEVPGEIPLFVVDCDQVRVEDILNEPADLGEGDGHHLG